jgi:hypothetical protein
MYPQLCSKPQIIFCSKMVQKCYMIQHGHIFHAHVPPALHSPLPSPPIAITTATEATPRAAVAAELLPLHRSEGALYTTEKGLCCV